jgi:class 3 adenylate cyclase
MSSLFSIKNFSKKPVGIGANYYPLRFIGYLFAILIMLVKAYQDVDPQLTFYWVAMGIFAVVPHISYLAYRLSGSAKKVELACLLLDTFWAGMFILVMDFSPFPSLMIFLMTCSGNLGARGMKQFFYGLVTILLGIAFTLFFKNFKVDVYASTFVTVLSTLFLAFYTLYFVYTTYKASVYQKVLLKEVRAEKKRSDALLLNILPEQTAQELKEKGFVNAQAYEYVTVMFTDFQDFTKVSEKMTPKELVVEIDRIYKHFDTIISKYNIEKIKTIGDAYMCAAGLPTPNMHHAEDVVAAGLDILQFIAEEKTKHIAEGKPFFEIRVGVHTGPLVAGVVGSKKFTYDIWGDTVNIASRMESSGQIAKMNISATTYNWVKHKYTCSYRGKIIAKNKGEIDMYFVDNRIANI